MTSSNASRRPAAADETQEDWVGFGRALSSGSLGRIVSSSAPTYLGGAIGPANGLALPHCVESPLPPSSPLRRVSQSLSAELRRDDLNVCHEAFAAALDALKPAT